MEQWTERENREYFRTGTIAAHALNPYRDSKRYPDPFTAFDIFPHLPKPPRVLPTPEEAAQNMRQFFMGMDKQRQRKNRNQRKAAPSSMTTQPRTTNGQE